MLNEVRNKLYTLGTLYAWDFIRLGLYTLGNLYAWDFIRLGLYTLGTLYAWDIIRLGHYTLGTLYRICFSNLKMEGTAGDKGGSAKMSLSHKSIIYVK